LFCKNKRRRQLALTAISKGWCDSKAFCMIVTYVIKLLFFGEWKNTLRYRELNTVNFMKIISFFWLIQSQAQFGPASAKTVNDYADGFSRVLL